MPIRNENPNMPKYRRNVAAFAVMQFADEHTSAAESMPWRRRQKRARPVPPRTPAAALTLRELQPPPGPSMRM